MRLCLSHQSPMMPDHQVTVTNKRVFRSIYFILISNILRLYRHEGILKGQLIIHDKCLVFFRLLVNCFTMFNWPAFTGYIPHQIGTISFSQQVPNHTIRRVHVMPWATPIRRIGHLRLKHIGHENDDPANLHKILMILSLVAVEV